MTYRLYLIPAITLIVGFCLGYFCHDRIADRGSHSSFVERREGGYQFINPLLECDFADDLLKNRELTPFKHKIKAFLEEQKYEKLGVVTGIYFRELNDGIWFSIGETERFIPASLRKLPLMIALLKQAERDKGDAFLDRAVVNDLSQDYTANQNIRPAENMVPGKSYPVRDLIRRMIVYSDNNAFTLLTKVVDPAELDRVYPALRMLSPNAKADDQFLSVQTYASFYRVLYNATYLSKNNSEWALKLLAESDFKAGLVSGVPDSILVAHKFGEKTDEATGTVQLHDCGIVYYPQHPYLLCIMSRGPDFQKLDDVIRGIAQISFQEVDAQHRTH